MAPAAGDGGAATLGVEDMDDEMQVEFSFFVYCCNLAFLSPLKNIVVRDHDHRITSLSLLGSDSPPFVSPISYLLSPIFIRVRVRIRINIRNFLRVKALMWWDFCRYVRATMSTKGPFSGLSPREG